MNDTQNRSGGSDLPRPRKKQESYVPPSVPQYPRNFSEPPTTAFPAPQQRHEDYGSDTEEYTIPFSAYTEEEYSSVYDEDDDYHTRVLYDEDEDIPPTYQPRPQQRPQQRPRQPQQRPQQPRQRPQQRPPQSQQRTQPRYSQPRQASDDYIQHPPNYPKRQDPPPRRRRRRTGCLGRLIRSIIVFAVVIFAIYSAISLSLIKKLEKVPKGERLVTSGTLHTNHTKSILLIGTDSRDLNSERGRSDSMILFTINSRTGEVYLTSFMRDAWVDIPNYGGNKLNAAYSFGGAELLMDTIEQNYSVRIDDYLCVSFTGFANIIDALGGVKIDVTPEEAEEINNILKNEVNELMGDDPVADLLDKGGELILNGKQALSYARIRYVGNADFERTSRQREVITQIMESAKTKAVSAIPDMISNAMPHFSTNMTTQELYFFSLRVPQMMIYDFKQQQIPADGTWSPVTIDGQSALQVDFESNIAILNETVYASVKPSKEE
ncbi:MAG: LCP family protein [Oscillospiraceae bacterium]